MMYWIVRSYFRYVLSLYYHSITVLNKQAVENDVPTIICSNHLNYTVDGMIFTTTTDRLVRVFANTTTLAVPGIREFLLVMKVILAPNTQDALEKKGPGKICTLKDNIFTGIDTQFKDIQIGSYIFLENGAEFIVKNIFSDSQVEIEGKHSRQTIFEQKYSLEERPNFAKVYQETWKALQNKSLMFTFPERTTHDFLQLRPLKTGISIMALGSENTFRTKVRIVPCIFHYYYQHEFRSKVFVEYGDPFQISQQMIKLYQEDRKQAIRILEKDISDKLTSMSLEFDSLEELPILLLARQLYLLGCKREVSDGEKLELNRRFAKGLMLARDDPRYHKNYHKLIEFSAFLKNRGISVQTCLKVEDNYQIVSSFIVSVLKCFIWGLCIIPGLILWYPIVLLVHQMAESQRLFWSKRSTIKQNCYHLVANEKLFLLNVLLPLWYIFTCILLYPICKKYKMKKYWLAITLCLLIFQIWFAKVFVKLWDRLTKDWKEVKYLHLRLFNIELFRTFEKDKRDLQKEIHSMVNDLGDKVVPNFNENRVIEQKYHLDL